MALPPREEARLPADEAERLAYIAAWMQGANASWQDRAVNVRQQLKMMPPPARDVMVACLRALHLADLIGTTGPTLYESDASADYTRWANTTRKPPAT
jgi:hypothetical protein